MSILVSGTEQTHPRVTFIREDKKNILESIKKKIEVPYYVIQIEDTDENYNDVVNAANNNNVIKVLVAEARNKIKRKPIENKDIYTLIKFIKEIG